MGFRFTCLTVKNFSAVPKLVLSLYASSAKQELFSLMYCVFCVKDVSFHVIK